MWQFKEKYQHGGITVHPGVVLKVNLIETDTTVSMAGSEVFKDIPKSILEPYIPTTVSKIRTKKK